MYADACHGGFRCKRCLTAELHSKLPTTDPLCDAPIRASAVRPKCPRVSTDHSHRLKERQLTVFYQLLPYLCRIGAAAERNCATVGCTAQAGPPFNIAIYRLKSFTW
jgi:hypothetical protein